MVMAAAMRADLRTKKAPSKKTIAKEMNQIFREFCCCCDGADDM
jgi:hypothetical protein